MQDLFDFLLGEFREWLAGKPITNQHGKPVVFSETLPKIDDAVTYVQFLQEYLSQISVVSFGTSGSNTLLMLSDTRSFVLPGPKPKLAANTPAITVTGKRNEKP